MTRSPASIVSTSSTARAPARRPRCRGRIDARWKSASRVERIERVTISAMRLPDGCAPNRSVSSVRIRSRQDGVAGHRDPIDAPDRRQLPAQRSRPGRSVTRRRAHLRTGRARPGDRSSRGLRMPSGSPTRVSISSSTPGSVTGTPAISTRTSVMVLPRYCSAPSAQRRWPRRPRRRMNSTGAIAARATRITSHTPSASERVPLPHFERVGPVLVLRQHPRQRFALVELQQDDLIARRRRQAARVGQKDPVRDALADRDARARVEVQVRRLLVRIRQQRRDLERVDAEGLLDDATDFLRTARRSARAWRALRRAAARARRDGAARRARCRRSAPGR